MNVSNSAPYANASYTASDDCYLVIGKDNLGKQGDATLVWK